MTYYGDYDMVPPRSCDDALGCVYSVGSYVCMRCGRNALNNRGLIESDKTKALLIERANNASHNRPGKPPAPAES